MNETDENVPLFPLIMSFDNKVTVLKAYELIL